MHCLWQAGRIGHNVGGMSALKRFLLLRVMRNWMKQQQLAGVKGPGGRFSGFLVWKNCNIIGKLNQETNKTEICRFQSKREEWFKQLWYGERSLGKYQRK